MRPFVRPRAVEDPALRLFVFHHAGGSAAVYHPLVRDLPADWDVLLVDLPGRGTRHAEAPLDEMPRVVERVVADVAGHTDVPYALFGHSMGAIVATEVGRHLQLTGRSPVWVGVSGRSAPASPVPGARSLSELPDGDLFDTLLALGGTPERLGRMPDLKSRFLRTVRADLRAVDSYRPDAGRTALGCPVTAFSGIVDPWAPPSALRAWEQETTARFRQCFFPGGHFYFLDAAFPALAREIRVEVRAAAAATVCDPLPG